MQSSLCTLVLKPPTQDTALNYWHPGASPQEQVVDGQAVLLAAVNRFPMLGDLLTRSGQPNTGSAAAVAQSPTSTVGPASHVVLPAPVAAPGRELIGAATGQAQAPASLGSLAGTTIPAAGVASRESPNLQSCARAQGASTLYIHIYSETSRMAATALRQALQPEQGAPLLVAPIENVVRNAELRQQRPPVPWANPTLVMHDKASRDCARAIAAQVGAPWLRDSGSPRVRLRGLPESLQAQPGVLELWLPPVDNMASDKK